MYLISPHKKQYKANLHCHSVFSDGEKTPWELKEMYRSRGYDVLAITDHDVPKKHSYLNDDGFLTITGYEGYVRPDPGAVFDVYAPEIHLNFFARDPDNETMICYNQSYCQFMDEAAQAALVRAGSERPREYTRKYINEYIQTARDNGYLVAYNHPYWSMEKEADLLAYEGCFSMEMCNYGSYLMNRLEYNGALYDKLLTSGKRIFCHSGDDNHNLFPLDHPRSDSFGAFTMLLADEFTYEAMIKAMEEGEMYSSMGPRFTEVSMEGRKIHIECSPVKSIIVFTGSKRPYRTYAAAGETLTCADFEIDDRALYVRVSAADAYGSAADTRGFFRDELEF